MTQLSAWIDTCSDPFSSNLGLQLMLLFNQELNKKALTSSLPHVQEEGCYIIPALFLQKVSAPPQSSVWKWW